jgi:cardiolipin synthase
VLIQQTLPSGEKIKLLNSGKHFFEELERLIDQAVEEIHFQIYIFENDETGHLIADALLRAAERGVKIYLLIDAFGSNISEDRLTKIKSKGGQVQLFGPLFKGGRFHVGRRLHRKVIVFDRKIAITGGFNISNNYNEIREKRSWLDFAVIAEGSIVTKLYSVCLRRWVKKSLRKKIIETIKSGTFKSKNIVARSRRLMSRRPSFQRTGGVYVRENDWLKGINEANATYQREIKKAKHSLFIVGGYFLPGGRMRRIIRHATKRGVNIQIILAAHSDVKLQRLAILYLYHWMLRNKITIYEYLPANVHGKTLIADKQFVSIGSYDLNNLSTYSNIELNLDIDDEAFASSFQAELEKISLDECRLVTLDELYRRSNLWRRSKHWFAYQVVKSLFMLSSWLARKDEEDYQ